MITNKLKCELKDFKNIKNVSLKKQDVVIYGGGIFAGTINGSPKIKERLASGEIKKLVIFAVGGTPNEAEDLIAKIWDNSFNEDEKKFIPHFYMQGGLNYEKLKFFDFCVMKFASSMMKKKKDKDENEKGFVTAVNKYYDISDSKYAEPLIQYIQKNFR